VTAGWMKHGHRRAPGAVDLDLQEVVALDPAGPGRGDLRQRAAFELEGRESVILDIDGVRPPSLVDPAGLGRHVAARYGGNWPQQSIEDVPPMGEHIEDQPAAACFLVIPARTLRRRQFAVEHPPAEIEPHRQDPPEEFGIIQFAELL
jgi:hypothetical protein